MEDMRECLDRIAGCDRIYRSGGVVGEDEDKEEDEDGVS
jgi:hypothetical protein